MTTHTLPFLVVTGSSEGSEPEVLVSRARQAFGRLSNAGADVPLRAFLG